MESFPPPNPAAIVHLPDDAPFLQPSGDGRSRWWLWTVLGLVAVAAVVLGVVLFADSVGDGTHPEASSRSTTVETVATSAATDSTAAAAGTSVATTDAREPTTTDAGAVTSAEDDPSSTSESAASTAPTTSSAPATTTPVSTIAPATTAAAPVVSVVPIPGWDLSGMTMSNVIVSPGKSNGRPSPGSVVLAPGVAPPTFPVSTDYVCMFWNVEGIPSGVPNGIVWTRDGQLVRSLEQTSFDWDRSSRDRPNWCVPSRPIGIDPGVHRVEYYVAGVPQWAAEFIIGGET